MHTDIFRSVPVDDQLLFDKEFLMVLEAKRTPLRYLNLQQISAMSCVYDDLEFGESDGGLNRRNRIYG